MIDTTHVSTFHNPTLSIISSTRDTSYIVVRRWHFFWSPVKYRKSTLNAACLWLCLCEECAAPGHCAPLTSDSRLGLTHTSLTDETTFPIRMPETFPALGFVHRGLASPAPPLLLPLQLSLSVSLHLSIPRSRCAPSTPSQHECGKGAWRMGGARRLVGGHGATSWCAWSQSR